MLSARGASEEDAVLSIAIPEPALSERELVDALAEAKPEAFHVFFERWFPRVHRFAAKRTQGARAAERVTERALRTAIGRLREGERPDDLGHWLLGLLKVELERAR